MSDSDMDLDSLSKFFDTIGPKKGPEFTRKVDRRPA
jgi:hypothetical protein